MTVRAAVIGAGLLGHGIAQVFGVAGHRVTVWDADAATLEKVVERVRANLERAGVDSAAADTIEPCATLEEAVADADVVTEAVVENVEVKQTLFAELDRIARPDAILATNTSSIPIGTIARDVADPGRVVGTHWWNPPHLVPLVEVTQAEATRPEVVEQVMKLLESLGKTPVHVRRDVPGFIGNRLQFAMWREAFALVGSGVCSAEDVDRVVRSSFGLRLPVIGPFEQADLIGLDLVLAITGYLNPSLDGASQPSPLVRERVDRGELGMKTGRGFRSWTEAEADEVRTRLFDHLLESAKR